jgi:hypothetical protein|tara:strand:+ start:1031 stop:1207 length:177 start_codon:yes stop_codon:yes gene_type:complete
MLQISVVIIFLITQGCSLVAPVASGVSSLRSEIRLKNIEKRLSENEKITDYLIQQILD